MLARYEKLIDCESFSDFTLIRADSPIPNLLAWLHMAKLSIALDVMAAQNGNSQEAAAHLLRHLRFATKVIPNSRTLITNLVAKAVARMSIWALNDIMNQKDCPPEVFQADSGRTRRHWPTRSSVRAFRSLAKRTGFPLLNSLPWTGFPDRRSRLLYQKNRTRNIRIGLHGEDHSHGANPAPSLEQGSSRNCPNRRKGLSGGCKTRWEKSL